MVYAGELLQCPAGWICDRSFEDLADEEALWLDPLRAELPEEREFARRWLTMDWPVRIGERFGKWLNARLKDKLPDVGYTESREWRRALLDEEGAWVRQLRETRKRIDAPGYLPFRKTHQELMAQREER